MYRVGLIGCGYIANKHLQTISQIDRAELVAISDIEPIRMKEAVQKYTTLKPITSVKQYHDYIELLKNDTIDIVVITTGSNLHAKMAIQALLHDKHVILEKPLALSLAEVKRIHELTKAKQKQVIVCHQLRYRPIMRKIKELITLGALGKLHFGTASMRVNRPTNYYTKSNWKGTWEKDGGMLINQGIHLVDLLTWFMGDVKSVYGDIANFSRVKQTEDMAAGIITFTNGSRGVIEANTITQPNNLGYNLSIFGEEGTISIGGSNFNRLERCYMTNLTNVDKLQELINDQNEHVYMYENFMNVLENKEEQVLVDVQEASNSLMTIFGIYESYRLNKVVDLPLVFFSTKDMKEG
ncbi:Predicted dehydrogenase [Oceanobacillus limi]|uniref:Predicted dehydrogenase n=1 Tax=Oceanobacillus limi TaxID=930131 RepID=A0A1I0H090_9BACI|nr:Gfo/Idh/MocA family oxidoreductase [Oceanobacillus limi]SET77100.1 Predicted dehydrogenase [Oceanobacillus limi]